MDETIRDVHRDLTRKFERHGSRVEELSRSLGQEQRKKIMRVASRDGLILKDPLDTSLAVSTNLYLNGTYVTSRRPRLISFSTFSSTEQLPRHRTSTLAASMEVLEIMHT
jgi:hypothetical protein